MGKNSETFVLVPEQSTASERDDDTAWLQDLMSRYGTKEEGETNEKDALFDDLLDDLTPEEVIAMQFEIEEAARERKPGKEVQNQTQNKGVHVLHS